MKGVIALFLLASLTAGCSSNSPLEVVLPFEPGTWTGTYSSEANYGSQGSVSQSGEITFNFTTSGYTYQARVTNLTNRSALRSWGPGTLLRDRGDLAKSAHVANMDDMSSLRAIDVPQRSLYLHGQYTYSSFGSSMTFSKQEDGLTFSVTLSKQ